MVQDATLRAVGGIGQVLNLIIYIFVLKRIIGGKQLPHEWERCSHGGSIDALAWAKNGRISVPSAPALTAEVTMWVKIQGKKTHLEKSDQDNTAIAKCC